MAKWQQRRCNIVGVDCDCSLILISGLVNDLAIVNFFSAGGGRGRFGGAGDDEVQCDAARRKRPQRRRPPLLAVVPGAPTQSACIVFPIFY
ncbi:hypothetical protein EJB05_15829 [Eragrostis curvula]|uniref:Uncharacterized protein n=1 Tax=Eragrostis curvula TaxID=38414 RepID=A0A5J9VEA6_9POAL|nr:hypothetical protein EJB05_15829 [Eragrostis curvula]